jgi:hypothetical protein
MGTDFPKMMRKPSNVRTRHKTARSARFHTASTLAAMTAMAKRADQAPRRQHLGLRVV